MLIVEILGQQIRQSQNPQSIFIDRRKLHSQNADDIWVAIKANRENLDTLMRIFEDFCSFSGLKINYDKTQVLRLGSLKDSDAQIYTQKPLNWVKEITVLCVKFSTNSCMMIQNNYQAIMQKLRGLCTCWSNRSLTLIGKVLVVNSLLVSQFFYKFLGLYSLAKNILTEFKGLVKSLIWQGNRCLFQYGKLILPYEHGGLKLVDLDFKDISLKAAWVLRVLIYTIGSTKPVLEVSKLRGECNST